MLKKLGKSEKTGIQAPLPDKCRTLPRHDGGQEIIKQLIKIESVIPWAFYF